MEHCFEQTMEQEAKGTQIIKDDNNEYEPSNQ